MQFQPIIRWSGSKRKQSEEIVDLFPSEIDTLWIPFLGGGSIVYQVVNSNIRYKRIVGSDIYNILIDILIMVRDSPEQLLKYYIEHYEKWELDGVGYYDNCVSDFNNNFGKYWNDGNYIALFYFINRCCSRGTIQYDDDGNFITKMSANDSPIKPNILTPLMDKWSETLQGVELRCESYEQMLHDVKPNDYVFLDPPYMDSTWYKDHNMDWTKFFEFCRALPCDYSITLNGDKDLYPIPVDLYTEHKYIYYGISTTSSGNKAGIRDSLWIKKKNGIYNGLKNTRQNPRGGGGKSSSVVTDFKAIADINDRLSRMEQMLNGVVGMLNKMMEDND